MADGQIPQHPTTGFRHPHAAIGAYVTAEEPAKVAASFDPKHARPRVDRSVARVGPSATCWSSSKLPPMRPASDRRRVDWSAAYPASCRYPEVVLVETDGELAAEVAELRRVVEKLAEFVVEKLGVPS